MLILSMPTVAAGNDLEMERIRLVQKEVSQKLQYHLLDLEEELMVNVKFRINNESRIEILAIDSSDKQVRRYINKRLKNEKILEGTEIVFQVIQIRLRFTPQSGGEIERGRS